VLYKENEDRYIVGILYERYGHLVLGTCLKYLKDMTLSEDITMSIFESLFDKLKKHDVSYLKGWLHTIARNECLMLLRKRKYDHLEIQDDLLSESNDDDNEVALDFSKLKEALASLKPDQKSCIELFYIQGYCYEEIVEELNMDFKKVKSNIQNGKRNLKIALTHGS
jgi:RNA polymerase sigma-70 factor (ECF subfamily)